MFALYFVNTHDTYIHIYMNCAMHIGKYAHVCAFACGTTGSTLIACEAKQLKWSPQLQDARCASSPAQSRPFVLASVVFVQTKLRCFNVIFII